MVKNIETIVKELELLNVNTNSQLIDLYIAVQKRDIKPEDKNTDFEKIYDLFKNLSAGEILNICLINQNRSFELDFYKKIAKYILNNTTTGQTILLTDAEKMYNVFGKIKKDVNNNYILTTSNSDYYILFKDFIFDSCKHVKIELKNLIEDELKYSVNQVYVIPPLTGKYKNNKFLTNDYCCIIFEKLINLLKRSGTLKILVPAKVLSGSEEFLNFRKYITENFKINEIVDLSKSKFTTTKLSIMTISNGSTKNNEIKLKVLNLNNNKLVEKSIIKVIQGKELTYKSWDSEYIKNTGNMLVPRQTTVLSEYADVFVPRISQISENICVLTKIIKIKNIENGLVNCDSLDDCKIDSNLDERFYLKEGDIILTAKGMGSLKLGIVKNLNIQCVASPNLIIIRPNDNIIPDYLKMVLDSKYCMSNLLSLQRGNAMKHISYIDVKNLEIPSIPAISNQNLIVNEYVHSYEVLNKLLENITNSINTLKSDTEKILLSI